MKFPVERKCAINSYLRSQSIKMREQLQIFMSNRISQKHNLNAIKEMIKTIEPLAKLAIPANLLNKTVIELINDFFCLTKEKLCFFGDCMVFVENDRSSQEDKIRKFLCDFVVYLNKLTPEERDVFVSLPLVSVNTLIEKDIKILDLDFSKTIKTCVEKYSYKMTEESLLALNLLLDKVILSKLSDLSFSDLLTYIEKQK